MGNSPARVEVQQPIKAGNSPAKVMYTVKEYEFSKEDKLGEGGFGIVFKGRHKESKEPVAIKKVVRPVTPMSQKLLDREIGILKSVKHANIVCLLECYGSDAHVYVVMEFCNGGDLLRFLLRKGTLDQLTMHCFLHQIAAAMKALHEEDIVHRDIKPQNILLSSNVSGKDVFQVKPHNIQVKLCDFGFARHLPDGETPSIFCGTKKYMSPELRMFMKYDAKSDLFAIGVTLYQCMTGSFPFDHVSDEAFMDLSEIIIFQFPETSHEFSDELKDLVTKLLQRKKINRMNFDDFLNHPMCKNKPAVPSEDSDDASLDLSNLDPETKVDIALHGLFKMYLRGKVAGIILSKLTDVHIGVTCDACKTQNIKGIRFKCRQCEDFDLCFDCEKRRLLVHDSDHTFKEIPKPLFE